MSEVGRDPFSQLLYPMLSEQPPALPDVITELAAAPLVKSAETNRLRREVLTEFGDELLTCAHEIAMALHSGGRLLVCGNGGSATAAADLAAELMAPPDGGDALPALCLTDDVAVLTAISNDVSFDDVFVRQLIALGRPGDIVVAISTSGNSENLVRAGRQARRQKMLSIGIAAHDGGRMANEALFDHCFVVRSSSVHRAQEAQTTVHHLLIEMVRQFTLEMPHVSSHSRPSRRIR